MIPPHAGIKTQINQGFPKDLKDWNVYIALEPTEWLRSEDRGKRRSLVNNFSAADGNTALLLEGGIAPVREEVSDSQPHHIIAASAKSATALKNNTSALKEYVEKSGNEDYNFLPKVYYSITACCTHLRYRLAISSSNLIETLDEPDLAIHRCDFSRPTPAAFRAGFLFNDQGSHYSGIDQHLFEHFSQFRSHLTSLDKNCQTQGFPSILPVLIPKINSEDHNGIVCSW